MTRKDYVAIAVVFAEVHRLLASGKYAHSMLPCVALSHLQKGIADVFAVDNPRFDREKFYAACEK